MMDMAAARERLIHHLAHEIKDKKVLEVMSRVPRELFVPLQSQALAYEDMPLSIDMGQTISQPYIVALMTEALELHGREKVLEVGTGSGYQAAILSELSRWVVSVERHQRLMDRVKEVLELLRIKNIELHLAGEELGWPKEAPYDAIIVTAGAPDIPQELLDQLAVKGRMVIPVGSPFEQELIKAVKKKDGLVKTNLGPCRFVPLIGKGGWPRDQA